eukprot:1144555-Pelagomonas_calceolata.AAC.11
MVCSKSCSVAEGSGGAINPANKLATIDYRAPWGSQGIKRCPCWCQHPCTTPMLVPAPLHDAHAGASTLA